MKLLIDKEYSDVNIFSFLKCVILSQFLLYLIIIGLSLAFILLMELFGGLI